MLFSVYLGVLGGKNPCRISALANSNYFVALTEMAAAIASALWENAPTMSFRAA